MAARILQPLRERDFALLWAGMAVSLIGDGIYLVAVAFQAYALHNAPGALAVVGLAWTGGMVALLPVAGVVCDRLRRRRVMMAADAVRAVVLVAIGLLSVGGALELWMLVALAGAYGAAEAFFGPAFVALVPALLPDDQLIQANAVEHTVRPLASRVAGPAIGGVVVGLVGPGTGFLIDAGTFVVSLACLTAMRVREPAARRGPGPVAEARAGMAYVRSQPWLWATLIAASISLLVFYGPVDVLVPYVIKNEMEGGAGGFGLFLAATGVGWAAGSTWMGRRRLTERPIVFIYLWWGIGTFPLCLYAAATHTWQMMLLGAAFGTAASVGMIVWTTLLQTRVPRDLLGRVSSLDWFVSIGLTPVSFALTAPVAAAIGIDATFVAAGALGGLSTLALLVVVPGLRERAEVVGEARVGDAGGVHPADLDALSGGEPGDGADHREPVVAPRVDRPPA